MRKLVLPTGLSFIAGFVDTTGFLAISGLFTSHVTGNFVTLGVSLATGTQGVLAKLLMLPVFVFVVATMRVLIMALARRPPETLLRLLLAIQAVLLTLFLCAGLAWGPFPDTDSVLAIVTGMLGVAAMAVQNAGGRLILTHFPQTTVMTGNMTQWSLDLVDFLSPAGDAAGKRRFRLLTPLIAGFVLGCVTAALAFPPLHFWVLLLPLAITLVLLAREPSEHDMPR